LLQIRVLRVIFAPCPHPRLDCTSNRWEIVPPLPTLQQ
jgi:hypothetical protein